MKNKRFVLIAALIFINWQIAFSQTTAQPSPTPKLSETLVKNLAQITDNTPISRERREQAYGKLLEGQRYVWSFNRTRSQTAAAAGARLAKDAFQKAVELDPTLAEGYTALAELMKNAPPYDVDESIALAAIAVKLDKNNYGGQYILAQLYTFKSNLNRGILDANAAQKAIAGWKEIARLDARNAEAHAFLSELYGRTNKPDERIAELRNWTAAAAPIGNGFYGRIFQGESLAPEAASLKLGEALTKANQTREAVEILSRAVAIEPDNEEAVELLGEAVEAADANAAAIAVESLQQAVYANPENAALVVLLARVQARTGKIEQAAKTLNDAAAKIGGKDKIAAANLTVALGDLYFEAKRYDDAVKAFDAALTVRGVAANELITDDARDFAIRVFDRMIEAYKKSNRLTDARAVIERARTILGKADLFADKKLISFLRETGKKSEALQAIQNLRARNADDYSLLRLEATMLAETGKVDEAVALVKTLIGKKSSALNAAVLNGGQGIGDAGALGIPPLYDDFTNYVFISDLYAQAKRGRDAAEAVNQAIASTQSTERKEIGRLVLASVQQRGGDFQGAETTLREILKNAPSNATALNNLGYFLAERGEKLDEALNLIVKACELSPMNPSFLDSLGWVYFKLGNLDEAEKNLKTAIRLNDASATIHEHLGDVYQKQGRNDAARAAWEKALNLTAEDEDSARLKTKINPKNAK